MKYHIRIYEIDLFILSLFNIVRQGFLIYNIFMVKCIFEKAYSLPLSRKKNRDDKCAFVENRLHVRIALRVII